MSLDGDPDGYATRDEIASYLERYADRFALPVRTSVEVRTLERIRGWLPRRPRRRSRRSRRERSSSRPAHTNAGSPSDRIRVLARCRPAYPAVLSQPDERAGREHPGRRRWGDRPADRQRTRADAPRHPFRRKGAVPGPRSDPGTKHLLVARPPPPASCQGRQPARSSSSLARCVPRPRPRRRPSAGRRDRPRPAPDSGRRYDGRVRRWERARGDRRHLGDRLSGRQPVGAHSSCGRRDRLVRGVPRLSPIRDCSSSDAAGRRPRARPSCSGLGQMPHCRSGDRGTSRQDR